MPDEQARVRHLRTNIDRMIGLPQRVNTRSSRGGKRGQKRRQCVHGHPGVTRLADFSLVERLSEN